jgi:hypothetical protein
MKSAMAAGSGRHRAMNALQDTSDLFSTDASVIGKSSKVRVVSHKALAIDEEEHAKLELSNMIVSGGTNRRCLCTASVMDVSDQRVNHVRSSMYSTQPGPE